MTTWPYMVDREIRAVIFDIDGTLVDSLDAYYEVFNRGVAHLNAGPLAKDALRDYLAKGLGLREIIEKVSPLPIDDATYKMCREEIHRLFRQVELEGVKLFPGTEELFRHLAGKGIKIGVATGRTSAPEEEQARFARLGLDPYISAIVTSRDIQHRKPAPDVIIECARRLDVPLKACVVVGDTEPDVAAARQAGAVSVAVTTGHDDEKVLLKARPDMLFRTIRDLMVFMESPPMEGASDAF